MKNYLIKPSSLRGSIQIPPSKSQTLRAIVFALLAEGRSRIENYLGSPDTFSMIEAARSLGAKIDISPRSLEVEGTGGALSTPQNIVDCGNSGQILRFIGALAVKCAGYTILTGDRSIRSSRPAAPLLSGLSQLGAFAISTRDNGLAPLIVKGPAKAGKICIDGSDSQPVSGLLMLAAFLDGESEILVENPGETPWVNLTLHWLKKFGIEHSHQDFRRYWVKGNSQIKGFDYAVPGDFSSALFPIAAALATRSEITLLGMDSEDPQGDIKCIDILKQMGADIEMGEKEIKVKKTEVLQGLEIDVNPFIDALPILSVVSCFAQSPTRLYNGAIARKKESDRIEAISFNLKKMGARIEEKEDGLIIYPSKLKGAELMSFDDHRIALSLSVAALGAVGGSRIENISCVAKSYPLFLESFQNLGAFIA